MQQQEKLLERLHKAGYPIASSLHVSVFDKVIGGFIWALHQSPLVDKKVSEILVGGSGDIGERIRISENIVSTLKRCKCPVDIQPHQIHGLDYPSIEAVLDWLISNHSYSILNKNTNAARDGDKVARVFDRSYYSSSECDIPISVASETIKEKKPIRKMKIAGKRENDDEMSEIEKVQACLLEYGIESSASSSSASSLYNNFIGNTTTRKSEMDKDDIEFEKQLIQMQTLQAAEHEKQMKEYLEWKKKQEKYLVETKSDATASKDHVSELFGKEAQTISKISSSLMQGSVNNPIKILSKADNDKRLIRALERTEKKLDEELIEINVKIEEVKNEVSSQVANKEKMVDDIKYIETSISLQDDIRELLEKHEKLRQQEKEKKQQCKIEVAEIEETIKRENMVVSSIVVDISKVDASLKVSEARASQARQAIGRLYQQSALLTRKIDDIPSQTELMQYEKRFVELNQLSHLVLEEHRKHFSTFNTLQLIYEYLEKEESILQSVHDTFVQSMKSSKGQKEFLDQLKEISKSVNANLMNAVQKRDARKAERDAREIEYTTLMNQQREYLESLKDFRDECNKNELLLKRKQEQR